MKKYATTKKEMFTEVIAIIEASEAPNKAELIERIEHEIYLATKTRGSGEKATAKAEEDKRLTNLILEVLADGEYRTISEIQAKQPELGITAGINTSKVTALATKAVDTGLIEKIKDKKKTYYFIPADTETDEDIEENPAE